MRPLMTIGYEATVPEIFDATLVRQDVDLLVDVRAIALSRKRGFSKRALAERLAERGIGYLHLRDLGDPKPGRDAARAGRWGEFKAIYDAHIQTAPAVRALRDLAQLVQTRRVVLLCYEADASTCHRSIIADSIANQTELVVDHLRATQSGAESHVRARTRDHVGEGCTAS